MSRAEAKQFYQRHQIETQYGGSHASDSYSPATSEPMDLEDDEDGMLPGEKRRTSFYDYNAEKQMSHEEAKELYRRHQMETQYGGSHEGNSYSPVMRAKSFPANFGPADGGILQDIDPATTVTLDDISQHRRDFGDQSSFKTMNVPTIDHPVLDGGDSHPQHRGQIEVLWARLYHTLYPNESRVPLPCKCCHLNSYVRY